MDLGFIGIGRMGSAMVARLLRGGHRVIVYDRDSSASETVAEKGAIKADSIENVITQLSPPRTVWVMIPSGTNTDEIVGEVGDKLSQGDIIIDGGNSYYKDTIRRADSFKSKGVDFIDVGVSGGIHGGENGYSLMIGADINVYEKIRPIVETLAPTNQTGYGRVGATGAGHFTKMIHNSIEYALMEAYAEGFELLQAKEDFQLDLAQISSIWSHGSIISSWLLDLTTQILEVDPKFDSIAPYVEDSGEGRWAIQESMDLEVPAPNLTLALQNRFRSRQSNSFTAKLLAAMRQEFGGHSVRKSDP